MKYFLFIFLLFSTVTNAEQFQAPLTNTQWLVTESPLECVLSQPIEGFGEAKFVRRSGSNSNFSLIYTSRSHPAEVGTLNFEIAEAPWQNIDQRISLASMPSVENETTFTLTGKKAKEALTHMQEGRFPSLRYRSHSQNGEISALFSTVHLNDSMPDFLNCLDKLSPTNFDDIRKLTVYYELEKFDLSDKAKASLKRIADYVKIDSEITEIAVNGYTDNHGRKRLNIELSEARALAIKTYLVEQGEVPENLITIAYHREFNPAKTNKTQKGRSYNRRAEIEVFR